MATMKISELNTQITIKSSEGVRDSLGGIDYSNKTTVFSNVWANVKNKSGNITYTDKGKQAHIQYVFTIRFRYGVSPKMFVYINDVGEELLIERVVDVENSHEWIEIHCISKANGGVQFPTA